MRRLSAHRVRLGGGVTLPFAILEFSSSGVLENIIDTHGNLGESAGIEFYNGLLEPLEGVFSIGQKTNVIWVEKPEAKPVRLI